MVNGFIEMQVETDFVFQSLKIDNMRYTAYLALIVPNFQSDRSNGNFKWKH